MRGLQEHSDHVVLLRCQHFSIFVPVQGSAGLWPLCIVLRLRMAGSWAAQKSPAHDSSSSRLGPLQRRPASSGGSLPPNKTNLRTTSGRSGVI